MKPTLALFQEAPEYGWRGDLESHCCTFARQGAPKKYGAAEPAAAGKSEASLPARTLAYWRISTASRALDTQGYCPTTRKIKSWRFMYPTRLKHFARRQTPQEKCSLIWIR